jgi:type I restriction enzyme R subunit
VAIVVDMLLTGFDSKYLNTLYVDKNLKYHGLIQAFSRTNRVLNDSKPYGNILDFRRQQAEVDEAVNLFSGNNEKPAKEIWLVEPAPTVVQKFEKAVMDFENFMKSQGLECKPENVNNLKGDVARAEFINCFKEVQRLKTQLDQYTDLSDESKEKIENLLPEDHLRAFRGVYIDVAQRLKAQQDKPGADPKVQQLEFEFVLFASAVIDYDYIMRLIAKYTQEPTKQKMTREHLISLLCSSANLMDERDDIVEYINGLEAGSSKSEHEIRDGYKAFKAEKSAREMADIATKHELEAPALQDFVDFIMLRMIFDGDKLTDLYAPFELCWKARAKREIALMEDLIPMLKKLAKGRDISGLRVYEE